LPLFRPLFSRFTRLQTSLLDNSSSGARRNLNAHTHSRQPHNLKILFTRSPNHAVRKQRLAQGQREIIKDIKAEVKGFTKLFLRPSGF
ncbi:hypothetical protein, partial [Abditibacterium utsteinense]|uniref:hypothetical protein n=1 Tax=Abditibacterium utsteinense TaxID=1960156 RepID=UPI001EE6C6E3